MNHAFAILVLVLLAAPAWAQSATIAVFPAAASNPNTATPITAVIYATPLCDQPSMSEAPPIVNPVEGFWADPARPGRTCLVNITPQIGALPVGTTYKGAVKIGTAAYGAFSTMFSVTSVPSVPHPCDVPPPTTPMTILVNTPYTLGWCHNGRDTANQPTTIINWNVYRSGTLLTGLTGTSGTVANAAGFKFYSIQLVEPAVGAPSYQVSATNSGGESTKNAARIVNVIAPTTPPATPTGLSITIP